MLAIVIASFIIIIFLVGFELCLKYIWPQNIKTTHINGTKLVKYDPNLGYICNPGAHVRVNGPEFSTDYIINSDGLRDEHIYGKKRAAIRILLIGDSFAFGAANDYDKIYPVIFENQLKLKGYDVDVIKAGVPFRNTDTDIVYLENILPKYAPDIVIYTFLPNNFFRNETLDTNDKSQIKGEKFNEDLVGMNNKTNSIHMIILLKRILLSCDLFYSFIYMLTIRGQFFKTPPNNTVKHKIEITEKLLSKMSKICKQKNVPFSVLSIPQQFQVVSRYRQPMFFDIDVDFIDNTFLQFAKEEKFEWMRTLPTLADAYLSNRHDCYFRLDGHLNNDGHALVGKYLANEFLRFMR